VTLHGQIDQHYAGPCAVLDLLKRGSTLSAVPVTILKMANPMGFSESPESQSV
jgi:hypothetical protein